jgi:hypothetical protein
MHTFRHGPLRLMLVLLPQSFVSVLLLDARCGAGLKSREIHRIGVHQHLGNSTDVRNETVDHVQRQRLAYDHAEDLSLILTRRERVVCSGLATVRPGCVCGEVQTGDDVLLGAEKVGDGFLLDVGVVFLELVGEREGYDGKTSVVVCAILPFIVLLFALFELELAFLTMDVTDTTVPTLYCKVSMCLYGSSARSTYSVFERSAQQPRIGQHVLHNSAVSGEAQVDQVVVLRDDLSTGS